jgi:hypothetical protein
MIKPMWVVPSMFYPCPWWLVVLTQVTIACYSTIAASAIRICKICRLNVRLVQ